VPMDDTVKLLELIEKIQEKEVHRRVTIGVG
jgi:hypothetical protein